MKVTFTLNRVQRVFEAERGESLQALLQREGIASVREADDGEGFVGADTILFDGRPALAGLMVVGQAEGHTIETVESLMENGRLSAVQAAMLDAGAVQSAYNSPAAALLIEELLRRNPAPTEDDVRDAFSGLFSRSTGYKQFFAAAEMARRSRTGDGPAAPVVEEFRDDLRTVGKARRRVDGTKLVAGMKAYVEDRVERGSCVLRMLRSPCAHARLARIAVFTHENTPARPYTFAGQGFPEPSPYDYRMFSPVVRYAGERVAAVIAENADAAELARDLVRVTWEELPAVLTLDAAMAPGASLVHGDHLETITCGLPIGADPGRNLAASASGSVGDVDRGFAEADAVIERTYTTSRVQCTPVETHVVYTRMDGDRLVIHASTQVPWHLRRIVAGVLGISENRVRVIKERIGGGFGSKQDILLEDVCAWATLQTGRAVYYKYTRKEEFTSSTTRHPFRISVKMGAKRDGTLTAIRYSADVDTGAYGNHALTVPMNSCSKSIPLLRCPNAAFEIRAWYTNHVPAGAYQGYGAPQGSFAVQTAAAELAAEIGMDQLDFLEQNRVRTGDVLEILRSLGEGRPGDAVRVGSCGLDQALAEGRKSISWGRREEDPDPDVRVGKGVAIIQQGSGLPGLDQACAEVSLLSDGSFMVRSGGADLGTGLDTVLVKIAAETLRCDPDRVAVLTGDTDTTPFDKGAYASSGTYFSGNAVLRAAQVLVDRILEAAARVLNAPRAGLVIDYPGVVRAGGRQITYAEIAQTCHTGSGPGELKGNAAFTSSDHAIPYAAHFCEVAVNTRSGAVEVRRYHAVHDSGTPINPELALGQVHGAVLKSIGHALYEEMIFDGEGRCLSTGLGAYGVPMIQELPRDLRVTFVTTEDPYGPFGAKSISEISMNGAAPAIAAAIHDAVGVWPREWPMTPERILRLLGRI
jgi:putative selenate reductase molybdopterin-binding subunit